MYSGIIANDKFKKQVVVEKNFPVKKCLDFIERIGYVCILQKGAILISSDIISLFPRLSKALNDLREVLQSH